MKAMISPVSVGKIQSLLFHRHRNWEGTGGGGASFPRFCNKQRRIMYFICSYIFIFDLFREGCPSTEVVFQRALFIFRKCRMASRTGAKLFTDVIEFVSLNSQTEDRLVIKKKQKVVLGQGTGY